VNGFYPRDIDEVNVVVGPEQQIGISYIGSILLISALTPG